MAPISCPTSHTSSHLALPTHVSYICFCSIRGGLLPQVSCQKLYQFSLEIAGKMSEQAPVCSTPQVSADHEASVHSAPTYAPFVSGVSTTKDQFQEQPSVITADKPTGGAMHKCDQSDLKMLLPKDLIVIYLWWIPQEERHHYKLHFHMEMLLLELKVLNLLVIFEEKLTSQ